MKQKIISCILIGSLSAMCLCGCGSNKSVEAEPPVTETVENSNMETEAEDTAGSSDTDRNQENDSETDAGGQNTETAGQNTDGQDAEAGGQNTETAGQEDAAAPSQNTSVGSADSDALDVSWGVIEQYGFNEKQESNLSFGLKGSTLTDCGGFYTIEATFYKPVTVFLNHEAGDIVEIVTDELTGERRALTYQGNGIFVDADNTEYRASNPAASGPVELYWFSDDRVEAAFYEGIIMISADAESVIAITDEKTAVSAETLSEDSWYNGVVFNDKKQAVTLTVYGD